MKNTLLDLFKYSNHRRRVTAQVAEIAYIRFMTEPNPGVHSDKDHNDAQLDVAVHFTLLKQEHSIDVYFDEEATEICSEPFAWNDECRWEFPRVLRYGIFHYPESTPFKHILFASHYEIKKLINLIIPHFEYSDRPLLYAQHHEYTIVGIPKNFDGRHCYSQHIPNHKELSSMRDTHHTDHDRELTELLRYLFMNGFAYILDKTPKRYIYHKKHGGVIDTQKFHRPQHNVRIEVKSYINLDQPGEKEMNLYGLDPSGMKRVKHPVRGHWRNQRCGPRHSKIRRTLVRPHIRGSIEIENREQHYIRRD